MFVPLVVLVLLHTSISSVSCEDRPIPDTLRRCLETQVGDLDNELIEGIWYRVYHFALWSNLPASTECREIDFIRPTQEDMDRYMTAYNLPGMPYTFKEDALLYNDTTWAMFSGLMLGNKEAKIFLHHPMSFGVDSESYEVVVIRYINENYILFEECSLRGSSKWLMSKTKHPSDEELREIIASQSDLMSMQSQKYCHVYKV